MNKQHGFTLLELMVTVVVAAIILGIAVPNFSSMLARHRLEAAASELKLNLQLARSQAIKRNSDVSVSFNTDPSTKSWRYGLSDDSDDCDPSASLDAADACEIDEVLKVYSSKSWGGVSLFLGSSNYKTISFEPRRGMARSGQSFIGRTFTLESDIGELEVKVSPIGHVNICVPPNNNATTSYRTCS